MQKESWNYQPTVNRKRPRNDEPPPSKKRELKVKKENDSGNQRKSQVPWSKAVVEYQEKLDKHFMKYSRW